MCCRADACFVGNRSGLTGRKQTQRLDNQGRQGQPLPKRQLAALARLLKTPVSVGMLGGARPFTSDSRRSWRAWAR